MFETSKAIENVLTEYGCTAVMHFAGLKSVEESVAQPLKYYDYNVIGAHRILGAMQNTGVNKLIFSSSATVYGIPKFLPCTEDHPLNAINPYGRTKLVIEEMLRDQYVSDPNWRIAILRYFNPVGAHESGLIGEDPIGVPNNLLPFVAQVAIGRRERLSIWGDDYDTPDGTGVRDYIHVMDLAAGHVAALRLLDSPKCFALNLGTGSGSSVLEVVRAFEIASGRRIPYEFKPRRRGDIDCVLRGHDLCVGADGLESNDGRSRRCAPIIGDGRAETQTDTRDRSNNEQRTLRRTRNLSSTLIRRRRLTYLSAARLQRSSLKPRTPAPGPIATITRRIRCV